MWVFLVEFGFDVLMVFYNYFELGEYLNYLEGIVDDMYFSEYGVCCMVDVVFGGVVELDFGLVVYVEF